MEDIITHLGGKVSTHSRLKAAGAEPLKLSLLFRSFNTQPPEGGWVHLALILPIIQSVSTHSRLKAAGTCRNPTGKIRSSFNTQPPEGGWGHRADRSKK